MSLPINNLFHDVLNYDGNNYDDERGNISAEFSVDDDGSVYVDSFHSAHESDLSFDYNGGHITYENKTNDEYSDIHNVQSSTLSYPKKVLVRGMAGIGKSTLAATVSCRQDQILHCIDHDPLDFE